VAGQRLDTRLEGEGAEFLVLGHLLVEGIEAHNAYTRFPGFDIIAFIAFNRGSKRATSSRPVKPPDQPESYLNPGLEGPERSSSCSATNVLDPAAAPA